MLFFVIFSTQLCLALSNFKKHFCTLTKFSSNTISILQSNSFCKTKKGTVVYRRNGQSIRLVTMSLVVLLFFQQTSKKLYSLASKDLYVALFRRVLPSSYLLHSDRKRSKPFRFNVAVQRTIHHIQSVGNVE